MDTLRTHAPRLLAGFGTAALVAGVGLFASSRPARPHSAGSSVSADATRAEFDGPRGIHVTFTGYLVDISAARGD